MTGVGLGAKPTPKILSLLDLPAKCFKGKPATPEESAQMLRSLLEPFAQFDPFAEQRRWLEESAARLSAPAPLPNPPAAPVRRLSGKELVQVLFERWGDKLPETITDAAKELAAESKLEVGSCKNLLRDTGAWEKRPRGQLKPPGPRSK